MNLCIVGVDPGASGALAFLFSEHPRHVSVEDMPLADGKVCAAQLAEKLRIMKPDHACLEFVHAMPGQGVTSMFNFGVSFGVTKGVILALGIPLAYARPSVWKKHFALPADKEAARELALRTWPDRSRVRSQERRGARRGGADRSLLARQDRRSFR